ncbi:hypothetical protein F4827_000424 [Paraburkholderia bannensis]|uniref:Uncharacterized protein n=1 Tax=Paraburkholderia bannensis TaxID=765414 RepID=A0A7W9WP13_9BURK|nr:MULTISPECIES: hypothetical protein [Paraburkholderia]MBB3255368.1 hypothetical protein [Paraburkholderia sp. WP4_3_2]MBB6100620.1 hypothetical protein [Paraburkholderia bannensis]
MQRTGLLFERWAEAVRGDALRLSVLCTGLNPRAARVRHHGVQRVR